MERVVHAGVAHRLPGVDLPLPGPSPSRSQPIHGHPLMARSHAARYLPSMPEPKPCVVPARCGHLHDVDLCMLYTSAGNRLSCDVVQDENLDLSLRQLAHTTSGICTIVAAIVALIGMAPFLYIEVPPVPAPVTRLLHLQPFGLPGDL